MTDIFDLLKGKGTEKQPVIVQGITGKFGTRHTKLMMEYGTNIAAGVTPGKGGQKFENSIPIYETMKDAVDATGSKISIMFVPAKFFLGAANDALEAGIKLLIAIPEHVPVQDAMKAIEIAKQKGAIIIGPNTPGVMIPELIKIGIMPASPFKFGNIAVLSKSGTLLYEIGNNLSTHLEDLRSQMLKAAENLEFEEAAKLRDQIQKLEMTELELKKDPFKR